jgi:hypothetical protein
MFRIICIFALLGCLAAAAGTTTAAPVATVHRELCERFSGFAGEFQNVFTIKPGYADVGAAITLVARPYVEGASVLIQVTYPDKEMVSSKDGFIVLARYLKVDEVLKVEILRADDAPTPFAFYSYVPNKQICNVRVEQGRPLLGPLPLVTDKAMALYVSMPVPAPLRFFTITLESTVAVTARVAPESNVTLTSGRIVASGTNEQGMVAEGVAVMYMVFRASENGAGTYKLAVHWSEPPAGWVEANAPPADVSTGGVTAEETGGFFGTLFALLFWGTIIYFAVRSGYNYHKGIHTFPDFVPHHLEIAAGAQRVKGCVTQLIDRARGNQADQHAGLSSSPPQSFGASPPHNGAPPAAGAANGYANVERDDTY